MYVVNQELAVHWAIPPQQVPLAYTDYDITVQKPNGDIVETDANNFENDYNDPGILEDDYTAPTNVLNGSATYRFTPDVKGVWSITLSTGTAGSHEIYYKHNIQVHEAETVVRQRVIFP